MDKEEKIMNILKEVKYVKIQANEEVITIYPQTKIVCAINKKYDEKQKMKLTAEVVNKIMSLYRHKFYEALRFVIIHKKL
jgi:predicted transcriptional regulator